MIAFFSVQHSPLEFLHMPTATTTMPPAVSPDAGLPNTVPTAAVPPNTVPTATATSSANATSSATATMAPVQAPVRTPAETPVLDPIDESTDEIDRTWLVIVWDDPINLMSYVVYVFMKLFGQSEDKATKLMWQVHNEGKAVVSDGTREKAELDVFRLHEHGLWATMQQDT